MKSRRVAPGRAFLVSLLIVVSVQANAQYTWKKVADFGNSSGSIGCGYFFDADNGLIGSGVRWSRGSDPNFPCSIFRTTDGGTTWAPTIVPTQLAGAVTAISMQDASIGYASIMPSTVGSTVGSSSLWKTTDGGKNWFDPFQFDHALTCVYGNGNLIVTTSWDNWDGLLNATDGGLYSTDGGQNWITGFIPGGSGNGGNGIAFSDALNGVVSEMNPDNGGSYHWYTTDGGNNWRQTNSTNQYESWSVYGVAGKHMFLTANEGQLGTGGTPHQQINWSSDGGATWARRFYFPHMQFTGTIDGMDSVLYVQTDTEVVRGDPSIVEGMYRSTDLGLSWKYIGGPAHSRDTRFVVTGCSGEVVYAFDGFGGVWKTTDGGDGTLKASSGAANITLPNRKMDYAVAQQDACKPIMISMPFAATGCGSATIDSVAFTANTNFALSTNGAIPRAFGQDSINILYQRPAGFNQAMTDSAIVFVHYHSSSQTAIERDTFVVHLPAGNAFALPRRSVSSGAYGQPVDLPLKEILPQFALDSLRLSGLSTMSISLEFDPSQLSYSFFASPSTLATSSIQQPVAGTVNVSYRNSGWTYTPGDFDLGVIKMIVQTNRPSEALIRLQDFNFVTKKGGTVYPCLTTLEDNMWQIEIQNTMSVSQSDASGSLKFTPSPFRDHIVVSNAEEGLVSLTLCDLLGRHVSTFDAAAGVQSEWNTSQLRPGMYVIVWQEGGQLHSAKLTKTE